MDLRLVGGGAKGAAHIGVLQAFKEENIQIDYISGTSSGSMVAALYACGYSPYSILSLFNLYFKKIVDFDHKMIFKAVGSMLNPAKQITAIAQGDVLEQLLYYHCNMSGITNILQIKMPIAIPAVEINSHKVIYFTNQEISKECLREDEQVIVGGNIASILRASSSFPVIFEPKSYQGNILVDGGLKKNVPISILKKMGADKVIAISFEEKNTKLQNKDVICVALRCLDIMGEEIAKEEIECADLVIHPNVRNIGLIDASKINMAANEGYYAAKKLIGKIKDMIGDSPKMESKMRRTN